MDASEKLERRSSAVMAVAGRPARVAAGSTEEGEGEGGEEEDTVGRRGVLPGRAGPKAAGGRAALAKKMPLCAIQPVRRGQRAAGRVTIMVGFSLPGARPL